MTAGLNESFTIRNKSECERLLLILKFSTFTPVKLLVEDQYLFVSAPLKKCSIRAQKWRLGDSVHLVEQQHIGYVRCLWNDVVMCDV